MQLWVNVVKMQYSSSFNFGVMNMEVDDKNKIGSEG